MSRFSALTLCSILLACAGSLIVSRTVFERLPHLEDEFAYRYQAELFARGDVSIDVPLPVRAYWQPFVLDANGQRFGKYPPGWPLLLAVGTHCGAPWIVNAWLAMLTVALVYRLGRELFDPATGAVAALLTAASPTALLLSGSLMSHTAALFFTTLFLYALWKIEKSNLTQSARRSQRKIEEKTPFFYSAPSALKMSFWGGVAGSALGMVVINRPWTAVGIAAPFVLYSAGRVLVSRSWRVVRPLIALTVSAALVSGLWPAYNYAVSAPPGESFPHYLVRFVRGDDDTNLYLRVWAYDQPGFGEGHGRIAHTPALGWQHTRRDLACAARDLFGWALPARSGVTVDENACLVTGPGLSWVLIPVGVIATRRRRWTWLLLALPLSLTAAYAAYWAGGRLYSARYLSEGLTAVTLISAAGVTALARGKWRAKCRGVLMRFNKITRSYTVSASPLNPLSGPAREGTYTPPDSPSPTLLERGPGGEAGSPYSIAKRRQYAPTGLVYPLLAILTLYALLVYTPARLRPLRGYGNVSRAQIAAVERLRRDPGRKLVVIEADDQPWRSAVSLMAVTSPYLDSDIVLARDPDGRNLDVLRHRWADREIIVLMEGRFAPP